MIKTSFMDGWSVRRAGEAESMPVSIPDDAMLREERSTTAPSGVNCSFFEGGDYVYSKKFTLDTSKVNYLEFEGVYRCAEVFLNGEKVAERPYGYTNFYVPLDGAVDGENEITVKCRNSDQPNSRWYTGSGIYRPVWLWSADREHIEPNGVKLRTLSIDPAKVEVTVKTCGRGKVTVELLDGEECVACAEGEERVFTLEVPSAKLWNPEAPYLYTLRVRFGTDAVCEKVGIRTLAWGRDGFLINGVRVILRGACIHHDNGLLGAKTLYDAEERRVRILMENGYNAIRSAHNPISKALLEACDKLGMLVMDEYIDHWYIHKTMYDYVDYFDTWWRRDVLDMVDKDYNHPSVILYSTGNEVAETAQKRGIALAKELTEFFHAADPTRPVTCGINIFFNFLNAAGFGQYSDEKAKKAAAEAEKARAEGKAPKERATGSKFFNDLTGFLGSNVMKVGATLHGSDVTTREAFANMDIAGYNYGEKRYEHDLRAYPDRIILGSETFCADAYRFWELAKKNPRLIGDFVWAGMDYLGETGIGTWEYAAYAPTFELSCGWMTSGSGRIDITGRPLGEAYYTRVAFERTKGPFITVRPVQFAGENHSPSAWKMTDTLRSWSWQGHEFKTAEVEVYARAALVELRINGKLVGKKSPKDAIARFKLPYESGVLEAISYDENGSVIGHDELKSATGSAVLLVEPEKQEVKRGSLVYVGLRLAGENGITKSAARALIDVEVEGGRLLGLGSAAPFYPRSYLDTTCDTYYGEAMAVIEAGDGEKITVKATAPGLSGECEVKII